ncbi:M10 family metallopeptidase [Rubellimicrobium roseum]|uniref:Peptidase metallopeptidase domain-containing protein n=1 Tax=Rubellimicrobium roseum TaxID=687525 RepID=A0A5C4NEM0_9RHOB|nr:M10 family metallopeptidase [Rubellimicrobium roseum]TNC72355.1 hypothetical protein FHG71_08160 [Rubellimicrobium roseum]
MAGTADPTATQATGNPWVDALVSEERWSSGTGVTTVSVYVAGTRGAESLAYDRVGITALTPSAAERTALAKAMAAIEEVCQLDFRPVTRAADADLVWASVGSADAAGNLGWAYMPGDLSAVPGGAVQALVAINRDAYDPAPGAAGALVRGSYDWCTLSHELAHAVGLKHPHDTEGGPATFPGVTAAFGDYGDHGLNQGLWTMMSYNDGWPEGALGLPPGRGWGYEAGPMALDIAALQQMYGADRTTRTGNDSYALPSANAPGAAWTCLWDAGGTDRIVGGNGGNVIDLRAATLAAGPGAAGFVSQAQGIHGGFTIAGGTVIENARGGTGIDVIRGNAAANTLDGAGGADGLIGSGGHDRLLGGAGDDRLNAGTGNDQLLGGAGTDRLLGGAGRDGFEFLSAGESRAATPDLIAGFVRGEDRLILSAIDANATLAGNQSFRLDRGGCFATGEIRQSVRDGDLLLEMNIDADLQAEMAIHLEGRAAPLAASDFWL